MLILSMSYNQKKYDRLQLYVKSEEKKEIKARARHAHMSISRFVVQNALGTQVERGVKNEKQ